MNVLEGKVCVITGATSGIGQAAAIELARMGARLVLVARDRHRGEATMERLRTAASAAAHTVHYCDLSRIAEMKRVAADIAASEPRIDILVNNAGGLFGSRKVTQDGLEKHFALNHMAYFVLTHGLGERLLASSPARVVNTTSVLHFGANLDFDDLQTANFYNGVRAYSRSKLCNVMWTRELARRWAGRGVTVNCFHPGVVASRLGNDSVSLLSFGWRIIKLFALPPQRGARTLIYLATSPAVADVTGGYFENCQLVRPSEDAEDDQAARRLWIESAQLAGIEGT